MTAADHSRWSEDLAAYALGALDEREAAELERHLEDCERCREELRRLRPAVQALPEAVERQEPPPGLRERLIAEVRADVRPEGSRGPARGARRNWFLRPAMGFAILALLVAGVVGYKLGKDGSAGDGDNTIVRQTDGITVKMVREGDGGKLELTGIHQLPPGKVLEAWVERDGEIEAAPALFVPDRHGHAETAIADMSGVEEVMVTEEPRGGSEEPTSKPIVAMPMPQ